MTMRKKKKKRRTLISDSEPESEPEPAAAAGACVVELRKGKEDETLVLPKLDDGFYEIETIRRKRIRKGEVQYLIKWHGWPETANTWEPLQNLQSVPDLIHAFELSLKSEQHRNVLHNPNQSQQPSTNLTPFPVHSQGKTNADPTGLGTSNVNTSKHIAERNQGNDNDPNLNELKATTNNGVDAGNLTIHFQQAEISTGNSYLDAQSMWDCIQSGRCRGAKRRKSGPVKRFKKETCACGSVPVDTQNTIETGWRRENAGYVGNNSHKKIGDAKTACDIVKIIKTIGYSASISFNIQDVSVTFMAMRSDGTEVMVDNKYLKAYNPLLLINFYEQHLRYSPTS